MKVKSFYTGLFLSLMLVGASSCTTKTCSCEDQFGQVQRGIELAAGEECSDLEPMLGTCTEE